MAKTVEDTAIVLQAVAGYDPKDPISVYGPVPDYRRGLRGSIKGVKVGVLEEYVGQHCTEEVEAAVRKAVDVLAELGAQVSEVSIPKVGDFPDIHNTIVELESAVYYRAEFSKEQLDKIDPDMKERIAKGAQIPMSRYLDAQRRLAFLRQEVDRVLREVDVVVSPTSLTPALKIAETRGTTRVRGRIVEAGSLTLRCTAIASDTGLPSISLPCGFAKGPLPIGLLIMGRRLEESLILRVAHAYEQATGWHLRHPELN
jgi:aspartyl-tRNA(Asn)/glutamyl-tRNA(Gln) amidotransferase subunit A